MVDSPPLRIATETTAVLLSEALQALPDAIAVFDADDRLVFWNARYSDLYSRKTPLEYGASFEDLIRASVEDGVVSEALGREEEWIVERLRRHRAPGGAYEHRLANGRWVRTHEHRSPEGWSIGIRSDITDLKEREESFRILFDANPTPMYVIDRETLGFAAVNDAALALYGYDRATFLTMTMLDTRPERDHASFLRLVADGSVFDYPGLQAWTHVRADGSEITILPHTKPLTIDGRPMCIGCVVDLTVRQRAEDEVRRTRAFLDSVVESMPVGVFVKDMNDSGRYVIYNLAGEHLVGRTRETILGRTDLQVFAPDEAARFQAQDNDVIRQGRLQILPEETVTRGDGEVRTILTKKLPIVSQADDTVRFVVGIVEDVTERERMASRLDHMAHHDALTGLPNRVLLHRRLDALVAARARNIALHYIDLDGFKTVNDTLGHRVGDALLCAVSARLAAALAASDLAVRLGGDEFVVLQDEVEDGEAALRLAERLAGVIRAPYDIDGQHVVVGASIGIAFCDAGLDDADGMMRDADTALYAAKAEGGRLCRLFRPEMDQEKRQRRELAGELMRALEQDEFVLFYQPYFSLDSGEVTGFEALIRWQHPVRGLIAPGDFIPVAEDLGMIGALGAWVVRRACLDASTWPMPWDVAVNLSPAQFREHDLLASIDAAVAQSGLRPERLELEITETVLLDDSDDNLSTLLDLRRLGVKIALDDFGTGFSSLSHVQRFAVDKIKIDRSFTRGLPLDRGSLAVVRAVVALARSLDIETTVEGVETEAQLACIKAEGCGSAQGYFLGRPAPVANVHDWLGRRAIRAA